MFVFAERCAAVTEFGRKFGQCRHWWYRQSRSCISAANRSHVVCINRWNGVSYLLTGFCFSSSTWFSVDKFSDPRTDPHCVRLLTLIRTVNNPREDNLVCLTVLLSARDKAIIVSTQETLVPHSKSIIHLLRKCAITE